MEQVTDGVFRLGTKWVNFYIVAESDGLTFVDTGVRGYLPQIEPALQGLGRKPADVKAIVLTHTHSDHIGCADRLVETTSAPVFASRVTAPSSAEMLSRRSR